MKVLIVTRNDIYGRNGSAFHLRNMIDHCFKKAAVRIFGGTFDAPLNGEELNGLSNFLQDNQFDVVIADYSWMCSAFDVVPAGVLKICFVHDLRCRIVPCMQEHLNYIDKQNWTEEKEGELLKKADHLLVLNKDDEMICQKYAPTIRIGIAMKPIPHDQTKEVLGRLLFVGSSNMENLYAVDWFNREVLPKVRKEVPYAHLLAIQGGDGIDEEYNRAQIVVAPHIMKGGLKIKVAEAFAHSMPVIGNSCAFDGFEVAGADDPKSMADELVDFFTKDSFRKYLISGAISRQSEMTEQSAYGQLLDILV